MSKFFELLVVRQLTAIPRRLAALVLLDFSAAYDTVDHGTILQRLRTTYGVKGSAHRWFLTYLSGKTYCVRRGSALSRVVELSCEIPQRSVLGPILFVLYTLDLIAIVNDLWLAVGQMMLTC